MCPIVNEGVSLIHVYHPRLLHTLANSTAFDPLFWYIEPVPLLFAFIRDPSATATGRNWLIGIVVADGSKNMNSNTFDCKHTTRSVAGVSSACFVKTETSGTPFCDAHDAELHVSAAS